MRLFSARVDREPRLVVTDCDVYLPLGAGQLTQAEVAFGPVRVAGLHRFEMVVGLLNSPGSDQRISEGEIGRSLRVLRQQAPIARDRHRELSTLYFDARQPELGSDPVRPPARRGRVVKRGLVDTTVTQ